MTSVPNPHTQENVIIFKPKAEVAQYDSSQSKWTNINNHRLGSDSQWIIHKCISVNTITTVCLQESIIYDDLSQQYWQRSINGSSKRSGVYYKGHMCCMFWLSEQQFRLSCRKNLYQFRKEAFKGAPANR